MEQLEFVKEVTERDGYFYHALSILHNNINKSKTIDTDPLNSTLCPPLLLLNQLQYITTNLYFGI